MRAFARLAFPFFLLAACASEEVGDDAASGGAGGAAPSAGSGGEDPFTAAPRCTSGRQWSPRDEESPLMHPGHACLTCHGTSDGPELAIAGTVYPTAHEPNDCNGVGVETGAEVVITDATGAEHRLAVNAAGNFLLDGPAVRTPFRAKVVAGGRERTMHMLGTIGDCNLCHTQDGANGAPGRIVLP